jgi:adenylate kinase
MIPQGGVDYSHISERAHITAASNADRLIGDARHVALGTKGPTATRAGTARSSDHGRLDEGTTMRVLLLAPPGAGKGTQGARLADHMGVSHIAAGDLLREQQRLGTPLGEQVRAIMARGDLVPDDVMLDLVFGALDGARDGFVLDGFPRTVAQAHAARDIARKRGLLAQLAIHLVVTDEEVVRRLLARGQGRPDDTECVIRRRLALYHEVATPLLDFYQDRGLLVEIDGMPPIGRVTEAIFAVVDATWARSA